MTVIPMRKTSHDGAIDVYNRVSLINDIYKGTNPSVRQRINSVDAIKCNKMKYGTMHDG